MKRLGGKSNLLDTDGKDLFLDIQVETLGIQTVRRRNVVPLHQRIEKLD